MTTKSNDQGRGFEFICLHKLYDAIAEIRPVEIIMNSSYEANKRAWETLDSCMQQTMALSANSAIKTIFELEPLIIEDGTDKLELLFQADTQGEKGDVRDLLIIRRDIKWEIGLSLKHNHFAVKHSRLSASIDFGEKWFGVPCSQQYWNEITPIFEYLVNEKDKGTLWKNLPNKEQDVYVPLLQAFIKEVERSNETSPTIPERMVEYLLGEFDFYKVISVDSKRITTIEGYNFRGALNKPAKTQKPQIKVPFVNLPTRIISIGMVPEKNNTVELCLNEGWQFTFRIHNASTKVEPSLKFDIQIVGVPATIISINCIWN